MAAPRRRVLWVGAFPPEGSEIIGGVITSCRVLRASSFAERTELSLIDSTQPNNPAPPVAARAWLSLVRIIRFVLRFERLRPDAVLLFASSTQASVAEKGSMAWYARVRGAAALIFPRGGAVLDAGNASPRMARWLRTALGGAHVVLCQGPAWHRFATTVLGKPARAAPIVPNWTATPQHLAISRGRGGVAPTPRPRTVHLVFVGWINKEKGTFELVEACRRLRDTHDFTLTLVGDGVSAAEIRSLIDKHGLGVRITMAGWLAGDALLDAYRRADAFVLPSWAEGLPNAMIEAMAAGLAVVVSAVGTIPGLVVHEQQALLVPPRDVDALTAAMARVIEDGALRARLGGNAAAWAAREFGVEQAADRMVDAVERAIAISRGQSISAASSHAAEQSTVRGEHA